MAQVDKRVTRTLHEIHLTRKERRRGYSLEKLAQSWIEVPILAYVLTEHPGCTEIARFTARTCRPRIRAQHSLLHVRLGGRKVSCRLKPKSALTAIDGDKTQGFQDLRIERSRTMDTIWGRM